jgi:hypothetical protein
LRRNLYTVIAVIYPTVSVEMFVNPSLLHVIAAGLPYRVGVVFSPATSIDDDTTAHDTCLAASLYEKKNHAD